MNVPEEITCVDCGQPARRLGYAPEEGWQVGDYVAYRCTGCNDRWDLVVTEEDISQEEGLGHYGQTHSYADEARAILQSRADDRKN
ncbi:MAG: hypothetical protein WD342_03475 [Verrucomicrobiales bacterium]